MNFCYWLSVPFDFNNERDIYLYTLANNYQDLECMLFDGYPNIYPQLRTTLESTIRFFLKFRCGYNWSINKNSGWNYDRVKQFIITNEHTTRKSFEIEHITAFPLASMIDLFVRDIPKFSWLDDIRLNETSHGIVTMHDEDMKEVFNRLFYFLQAFYMLYFEITESWFNVQIPLTYKMPSDNDLKQIVEKYIERKKSYLNYK